MSGGNTSEELNLVPYLDIMVNLIMFLIIVTAFIVDMRQDTVLGPSTPEGGATRPFLTVVVLEQGFAVLSSDTAVPAWQTDRVAGNYPYDVLREKLRSYKDGYALSNEVIVTADPQIPYQVVTSTVDAVKRDEKGQLFAGITFGVAVDGH